MSLKNKNAKPVKEAVKTKSEKTISLNENEKNLLNGQVNKLHQIQEMYTKEKSEYERLVIMCISAKGIDPNNNFTYDPEKGIIIYNE